MVIIGCSDQNQVDQNINNTNPKEIVENLLLGYREQGAKVTDSLCQESNYDDIYLCKSEVEFHNVSFEPHYFAVKYINNDIEVEFAGTDTIPVCQRNSDSCWSAAIARLNAY